MKKNGMALSTRWLETSVEQSVRDLTSAIIRVYDLKWLQLAVETISDYIIPAPADIHTTQHFISLWFNDMTKPNMSKNDGVVSNDSVSVGGVSMFSPHKITSQSLFSPVKNSITSSPSYSSNTSSTH